MCQESRFTEQGLLPSNPLTAALSYALERRLGLEVYLTDPDVPIDTHHLERALRAIPMGRKAWLFCWTEVGAKYVGILQSLLVTCRLHRINPYDYLVAADAQPESAPLALQEGPQRPVLAVVLAPEEAAVLELRDRRELRVVLDTPEIRAQGVAQQIEAGLPLAALVGPEDRDRRRLDDRVVAVRLLAQPLRQRVEHRDSLRSGAFQLASSPSIEAFSSRRDSALLLPRSALAPCPAGSSPAGSAGTRPRRTEGGLERSVAA
jgi:hypothetical protein